MGLQEQGICFPSTRTKSNPGYHLLRENRRTPRDYIGLISRTNRRRELGTPQLRPRSTMGSDRSGALQLHGGKGRGSQVTSRLDFYWRHSRSQSALWAFSNSNPPKVCEFAFNFYLLNCGLWFRSFHIQDLAVRKIQLYARSWKRCVRC